MGDTYFILDDEVIKITEVKFKEGINLEEIIGNLRNLPYLEELKLFPKNDHHIVYSRIDIKNIPFPTKQVDKILDLQRRGLVVFERGTFDGNSVVLYVVCEDSLLGEVISAVREVYSAVVLSVEDYTPGLLKLSKRQREIFTAGI